MLGMKSHEGGEKGYGQCLELEAVFALLQHLPLQGQVITGDAQLALRGSPGRWWKKGGLLLGGKGEPPNATPRHRRPLGPGAVAAAPGGADDATETDGRSGGCGHRRPW